MQHLESYRRPAIASLAATLLLVPGAADAESRVDSIPVVASTGSLDVATLDNETWESEPAGFSFAEAYRAGTQDYLVLVRRHTGEVEIRNLGNGTIDSASATYHLHRRFTGADVVMLSGTPYLFLHDAATGYVRTYVLEGDGTFGTSTETTNSALADRELFATFTVGTAGRFFAYDRWTGQYVVYSTAGALVASGTWTRGWTSVDFITYGGSTYRLLYKAADEPGNQGGRLQITRIDSNFATLSTVHDAYHAEDWSTVRFLSTAGTGAATFVAFYDAATGEYATRSFDGSLGSVAANETIETAWNDMATIRIGSTAYALMLSETGVTPLSTSQIDNFAASARAALTTPCSSGNCVAGYQLAMLENGRVVFKEAGGVRDASATPPPPVTDDTTFSLGSVSKVITSATAMRLIDWGEMDIDAPLVNYLDYDDIYDYGDFDPGARYLTVREALEHTVGIVDSSTVTCPTPGATAGVDCTPYLAVQRTDDCVDNPAIDDPNAVICDRRYANENTALLRALIEHDMSSKGMQPIVDLTRTLWMDDTHIEDRTCAATPSTDSDLHDGLPFAVTQSWTNTACAPGGWKLSALDVGEVAWALRHEVVIGPELTLDLFTDWTGARELVWDRLDNVGSVITLAYKRGNTDGLENHLAMEVAGPNREIDVALLINTTATTGVFSRTVIDNAFNAMGNP